MPKETCSLISIVAFCFVATVCYTSGIPCMVGVESWSTKGRTCLRPVGKIKQFANKKGRNLKHLYFMWIRACEQNKGALHAFYLSMAEKWQWCDAMHQLFQLCGGFPSKVAKQPECSGLLFVRVPGRQGSTGRMKYSTGWKSLTQVCQYGNGAECMNKRCLRLWNKVTSEASDQFLIRFLLCL